MVVGLQGVLGILMLVVLPSGVVAEETLCTRVTSQASDAASPDNAKRNRSIAENNQEFIGALSGHLTKSPATRALVDSPQDLAQETSLRLLRTSSQISTDSQNNVELFISRTMRNIVVDRARVKHLRHETQSDFEFEPDPTPDPTPLERVITDEVYGKLHEALQLLPENERQAVVRFAVEEDNYAKIGTEIGGRTNYAAASTFGRRLVMKGLERLRLAYGLNPNSVTTDFRTSEYDRKKQPSLK